MSQKHIISTLDLLMMRQKYLRFLSYKLMVITRTSQITWLSTKTVSIWEGNVFEQCRYRRKTLSRYRKAFFNQKIYCGLLEFFKSKLTLYSIVHDINIRFLNFKISISGSLPVKFGNKILPKFFLLAQKMRLEISTRVPWRIFQFGIH